MKDIRFRAWDKASKFMYPNVQNHINDEIHSFGKMVSNPDRFDIMQFTGLKDKNGKEIYEGDIMLFPSTQHKNYKVYFKEGKFQTNSVFKLSAGEIIGNIYENPELL